MRIDRSLFGIACRAAAFSFLIVGTASLVAAQPAAPVASTVSAPPVNAPLLLASESASTSAGLASASYSSSSSSMDADAVSGSDVSSNLDSAALDSSQPPPRRYGRPSYGGGNSNADGSSKYIFQAGAGLAAPVGDTHVYDTPSWEFQFGGGRNYNKVFGVLAQFDYDHFGLQGQTLANQSYVYDYYCTPTDQTAGDCAPVAGQLDGNSHVWSFTLNPTFTLPTSGSWGAYVVVGGGFYHKVTNFTLPALGEYCDPYYGCYEYQANQNIDHYTSNAPGVSGGFGITRKFSHFSNEQFYMEARYVVMLNSQRTGVTSQNVGTSFGANYAGYDYYPANSNRTTYIPVTFGIRF